MMISMIHGGSFNEFPSIKSVFPRIFPMDFSHWMEEIYRNLELVDSSHHDPILYSAS